MSDITPTPVESSAPQAEPPQEKGKQKKSNALLMGCLVALAVIAIIVLAFFLLRGCSPGQTSGPSKTASQPATSTAGQPGLSLDQRVHAALHAKVLPNGARLDEYVYIFEVTSTNGVGVAITLTPIPVGPGLSTQRIATDCEDVVLAAVPEVSGVAVVDANRTQVSVQTRK